MKRKLHYLIVIFVLLFGCKRHDRANFESMKFDELFTYFVSCNDSVLLDSISQIMYDSILMRPNCFFYPIEEVDSTDNELNFKFGIEDRDFVNYSIKERNIFFILINRADSIKAERKLISSIDSLVPDFKNFMTNPMNTWELPEKREKYIELLDTVTVCHYAFFVDAQTIPDTLGNRTSWVQVKKAVNLITETIIAMRNEVSIFKWNKEYNQLKLNQKVALSQYFPILIWVHPNVEIIPPPPPPPDNFSTKEKFDSDKELTKIILENSEKE